MKDFDLWKNGPSTPAEYHKPGYVAPEVIDGIARWIAAPSR
ncbi:MAG TPA: hypothetical protein VKR61_00505 [Bryobacteraceae bacterium]|nr:hypothetical protein [Bryobacteraceae bacterium]